MIDLGAGGDALAGDDLRRGIRDRTAGLDIQPQCGHAVAGCLIAEIGQIRHRLLVGRGLFAGIEQDGAAVGHDRAAARKLRRDCAAITVDARLQAHLRERGLRLLNG